jgi:NAD+ synthase (glutamine-hydrolysing)
MGFLVTNMRIALAQLNTIVGDLDGNQALILAAYREAVAQGAELVLTPELAITGYPPRDLVHRMSFVPGNLQTLQAIADEVGEVPLIVGFIGVNESHRGNPFRNAAAVLQSGRIAHVVHKTLLPTYDVFDEDRYFEPASSIAPVTVNGQRLGVTICEDIWTDDYLPRALYAVSPPEALASQGIDLLVNISASPFCLGKPETRERMLGELAQKIGVPIAYCNAIGGNDQLVFDGNSLVVSAGAEVLSRLKSFASDLAVVDTREGKREKRKDEREDAENLYEALVLGLRDYVHKCGFKSCVLGLSGGIDSALVAVIAAEALGPEHVLGVSLPSQYSSEGSKDDARDLAQRLGIGYETIAIEPVFESVKAQTLDVFAGRPEDITEENMQSRIRGLILMSISNKLGHMLLTTGNKSEMAVGYCTIYGDMCGGLSVISDLPKTRVYEVSRWINREREIIPWASIEKPPSAELRPDQKDQDTLPEYDVLDGILELLVEQGRPVAEIVASGYNEDTVRWILRRIEINEWKRHQAAPGLKVTSKAFGIGRRMPIVQKFRE